MAEVKSQMEKQHDNISNIILEWNANIYEERSVEITLTGSTGVTRSCVALIRFVFLPWSYMCQAVWRYLGTAARPASTSNLIKSQSQRQLGQSNKIYCNADLMPSPAAQFVCPYCHGSVQLHKQYILKLDSKETG